MEIRAKIHKIEIDTTHTSFERIGEQIQNYKKYHAGKTSVPSMVFCFYEM